MFFLEIYEVSEGAEIDPTHRYANITISDSDYPRGLFRFAVSSRFVVAMKKVKRTVAVDNFFHIRRKAPN